MEAFKLSGDPAKQGIAAGVDQARKAERKASGHPALEAHARRVWGAINRKVLLKSELEHAEAARGPGPEDKN